MKKPPVIVLALALALALAAGLSVSLISCAELENANTDNIADELIEESSDDTVTDTDDDWETETEAEADAADRAGEDGHDADEPEDDAEETDEGADTGDDPEDSTEADEDEEESAEYVAYGSPTRYEDSAPHLSREGNWITDRSAQASGGTMTRPADPTGCKMEISFKGTGAKLVCGRNNSKGNIYIKLEGESGEVWRYHTIDIATTSQSYEEVIWDSGTLPRDLYTVTIWMENKGVWIDAMDIWGNAIR